MNNIRICNQCGWAHFGRTRQEVEQEADDFGRYIQTQPPEVQAQFGFGPLSKQQREWSREEQIKSSARCFRCGNDHKNFHDETPNDHVPVGCTMQGIII